MPFSIFAPNNPVNKAKDQHTKEIKLIPEKLSEIKKIFNKKALNKIIKSVLFSDKGQNFLMETPNTIIKNKPKKASQKRQD
jgi:hypothetical protein